LSGAVLAVASLLGLGAFLYPFFLPVAPQSGPMAHANDAPLLTVVLLGLCLVAVFTSMTGQQMTSKLVAVLGVLTAANAVLRAVPGPAGFNAIFVLPILTGFCYGPTFGFLLGVLSLLVSALIGGGVGPWLPYQMLTAGFVGLFAGWLPRASGKLELLLLAGYGMVSAFTYGWLMDFSFWPFAIGEGTQLSFDPAATPWENLHRFVLFNLATSMGWNLGRALTNAVLIVLLGAPLLRLLRRAARKANFVPVSVGTALAE